MTERYRFKYTDKKVYSDKDLVKLLITGSSNAFEELYARYRKRLMYFCKRFLKNDASVEDLIQDIFIQLWETRQTLDPDLSFSGYIHTMARNRILNIFRQFDVHNKFTQNILKSWLNVDNNTEDEIMDRNYSELLDKAIGVLSPKQREVFRLSRMEGFSYKEISEILNISVPTVQEHASLALKKIKEFLEKYADIYFKTIITLFISGSIGFGN